MDRVKTRQSETQNSWQDIFVPWLSHTVGMEMCQRKCLVAEFGQIKGLVRYYLKTKRLASKNILWVGSSILQLNE